MEDVIHYTYTEEVYESSYQRVRIVPYEHGGSLLTLELLYADVWKPVVTLYSDNLHKFDTKTTIDLLEKGLKCARLLDVS